MLFPKAGPEARPVLGNPIWSPGSTYNSLSSLEVCLATWCLSAGVNCWFHWQKNLSPLYKHLDDLTRIWGPVLWTTGKQGLQPPKTEEYRSCQEHSPQNSSSSTYRITSWAEMIRPWNRLKSGIIEISHCVASSSQEGLPQRSHSANHCKMRNFGRTSDEDGEYPRHGGHMNKSMVTEIEWQMLFSEEAQLVRVLWSIESRGESSVEG